MKRKKLDFRRIFLDFYSQGNIQDSEALPDHDDPDKELEFFMVGWEYSSVEDFAQAIHDAILEDFE